MNANLGVEHENPPLHCWQELRDSRYPDQGNEATGRIVPADVGKQRKSPPFSRQLACLLYQPQKNDGRLRL